MIQRCLAIFTRDCSEVLAGMVESQYLVGSDSFFGHSIKSHSSGCGSVLLVIAMGRTYADSGETGTQLSLTALAPGNVLPGRRWQTAGQLLYRNGLMICIALQAFGGRTPTWFARWRRQGLLPRFPDGRVGLNAHDVWQSELGQGCAELCALSVTRICQYHSYRDLCSIACRICSKAISGLV